MGIDKRISTLIEILGLTSGEFADKINVQRSSISHITSARNKPSLDFLERTLSVFPEINSEWLILGKGKPLKSQSEDIKKAHLDLGDKTVQKQLSPSLFDLDEVDNEEVNRLNTNNFGTAQMSENSIKENSQTEDQLIKNSLLNKKENKKKKIAKILIIYEDNTFEAFEN
ncbi:MAG: helix-turn-helix transcriptional regulator [Apibacter sp.]|nr:helix-turn-helix transcriptional regulator [Apibacter sp.]